MISLIKLDVVDGKVVRHEDWYALKFFIVTVFHSVASIY